MPRLPLTHGEKRALELLRTYHKEHDTFPTRRQMAAAMKLRVSNAQRYIDGLVKKKVIFRLPGGGNFLNGISRLSFEPFDRDLVAELTPPPPPKQTNHKVTIFLNSANRFTRFEASPEIRVLIKKDESE